MIDEPKPLTAEEFGAKQAEFKEWLRDWLGTMDTRDREIAALKTEVARLTRERDATCLEDVEDLL